MVLNVLVVEETGRPGENQRPVASHRQKINLTRKNAYLIMHYIPTESSLFGVAKYQICFTDRNSQTYSSQKEVK
jgi:hypothetical protein